MEVREARREQNRRASPFSTAFALSLLGLNESGIVMFSRMEMPFNSQFMEFYELY
jgi:hypothetical protein